MNKELVIVLDFGGQYNQLVARRVRECNVYCEIYSYKTDIEKIKAMNPKGIILTGGPNSCYEEGAPTYSKELFELGIPVLGLCYGAQLMQHVLGGKVEKAPVREYGKTDVPALLRRSPYAKYPHSRKCRVQSCTAFLFPAVYEALPDGTGSHKDYLLYFELPLPGSLLYVQ